jgi:dipeptidyl aminopeptidase/acylaminoacyl peptidase
MSRGLALVVSFLLFVALLPAAEAKPLVIDNWLVLGPEPLPLGAWPDARSILDYEFLNPAGLQPVAGQKVEWSNGHAPAWRVGQPAIWKGEKPGVVYLAAYLEGRRFLSGELEIEAPFPVTVCMDGMALEGSGQPWRGKLKLETGKHLLLVKGALSGAAAAGGAQAKLNLEAAFGDETVVVSQTPGRFMNMDDVLKLVQVNQLAVSPDGSLVAVELSQKQGAAAVNHAWTEIVRVSDGRRLFSSQNIGVIGDFCWLKDSRRFSFSRRDKDLTSLYIHDLQEQTQRPLISGITDFSGCWWAADNRFLVYAQTPPEVKEERSYRFIPDIPHRSLTPATRTALTLLVPSSGARLPLSSAAENFQTVAISPDGRSLILGRTEPDELNRPFEKKIWEIVDLATFSRRRLLESGWISELSWAPDSKRLLLLGGASAFDGLGRDLPDGVVGNEGDVQAYIYDIASGKAEAISRHFDPAIDEAAWLDDGRIYLRVTDQDCSRLYRYDPREKSYSRLDTGVDCVSLVAYGRRGPAVFWGSGASHPFRLYRMGLGGEAAVIADYNRSRLAEVRLGRVENWRFTSPKGRSIPGSIYYPPDFDPHRTWPCIVNYYAGTTPITRDFGGRYPKEWYAANGYVVYVIQPSGAVGFGQAVSAAHVNDWGELTSEEILAGVEELLRSHSFIDPQRLGAIGASYGGFMSQYLATRTDRFATFISHAGISDLTSYWGVGDWGVSYSATASALSFPWNRKDLYVGHSPLFMAERISRPLLLLHGESDNNVPPGESYQMYAALKLLGKEVALVTFPGQQHWILEYDKRVQWMKTIMAWFDRWLKKQPEAWFDLYPQDQKAPRP